MKARAGFVGIGAMGGGMATNLCRNGFETFFYARDTARGDANGAQLIKEGARRAADLATLARRVDVVILCLPDSPAVEAVLSSEAGLVAHLAPGSIIVDCSTSQPESTQRLAAELADRGIPLLEGPLTGSRAQAQAGTVSVLGAGSRADFERVRPVLEGFASNVFYLGGTGAGHAAKLINNYFGQLALAGLCEAWPLIKSYGLDSQALFDAISASGGNSATFQSVYPKLRDRDFTFSFAQKLAAKDIRYFRELTGAANTPAPLADALRSIHEQATEAGFGDQDVKSLLLCYEQRALRATQ